MQRRTDDRDATLRHFQLHRRPAGAAGVGGCSDDRRRGDGRRARATRHAGSGVRRRAMPRMENESADYRPTEPINRGSGDQGRSARRRSRRLRAICPRVDGGLFGSGLKEQGNPRGHGRHGRPDGSARDGRRAPRSRRRAESAVQRRGARHGRGAGHRRRDDGLDRLFRRQRHRAAPRSISHSSSAAMNSSQVWNRCAGSRALARMMMLSNAGSRSGTYCRAGMIFASAISKSS